MKMFSRTLGLCVEPRLQAPAELGERAHLALTLSGLHPVMSKTRMCQEQAGSFY